MIPLQFNRTPRWYCTFCKSDKPLPPPEDNLDRVAQCPTCHNTSCVWLSHTPRIRAAAPKSEPFLKRQPQAAK